MINLRCAAEYAAWRSVQNPRSTQNLFTDEAIVIFGKYTLDLAHVKLKGFQSIKYYHQLDLKDQKLTLTFNFTK